MNRLGLTQTVIEHPSVRFLKSKTPDRMLRLQYVQHGHDPVGCQSTVLSSGNFH